MEKLAATLVLILGVASLYGWGVAARRFTNAREGGWATTIALGLAALLFAGGLAALARIAYAPALWALALAGLVPCAWRPARRRPVLPAGVSARLELALAALVIAAAAGFAIATQLPPRAFNFHDDFEKYFAFPVRLLATGTLAGAPLNALGAETLGGISLLHGMVLSAFPIRYINGVDAVFGLLLLMALAASAGWRRLAPLPGAALAPLLIAVVNPQYVNVSGLYLGAALIAAAIVLVAEAGEADPPAAALGLVYAALVAIKPTFALFPALHLPLAMLAVSGRRWRWAGRVALWTAIALVPWAALHAPVWLGAELAGGAPAPAREDPVDLLSAGPLFYGASYAHYTALAGLALLAALWAAPALRSPDAERRRVAGGVLAGAAAGAIAYPVVVLIAGPMLAGHAIGVRYAIPVLLACAPVPLVLAAGLARQGSVFAALRWQQAVPAVALLAMTAAFIPPAIDRARQAIEGGSIIAFSRVAQSSNFLAYSRFVLSDRAAQRMRTLQAKVPAGKPLLAWVATPFLLDYRRNPIFDAEAAGIATPWARIPAGVRYVMWQHRGYAVRGPADYRRMGEAPGAREWLISRRALDFRRRLEELVTRSEVIYLDDSFAILRLGRD